MKCQCHVKSRLLAYIHEKFESWTLACSTLCSCTYFVVTAEFIFPILICVQKNLVIISKTNDNKLLTDIQIKLMLNWV